MPNTDSQNRQHSLTVRPLFVFKCLLFVITGFFVFGDVVLGGKPFVLDVSVFLFLCSITALVVPVGWTIPCIIVGAMIAFFGEPMRGRGPQEIQAMNEYKRLLFAPIGGLLIGLWIDFILVFVPRLVRDENEKKTSTNDQPKV